MFDPDIWTKIVSSGEQALAFLKTATELPSLIFLDLNMLGMNGIETLMQIRADDRVKDIPVVILTLSTLGSDAEEASKAGATGFVQKAIRLHELSSDLEQQVRSWYVRKKR
jgi:CheY-like chemotaxis protein